MKRVEISYDHQKLREIPTALSEILLMPLSDSLILPTLVSGGGKEEEEYQVVLIPEYLRTSKS
jgi:hypothetical protein